MMSARGVIYLKQLAIAEIQRGEATTLYPDGFGISGMSAN